MKKKSKERWQGVTVGSRHLQIGRGDAVGDHHARERTFRLI